jgi:hypothetical protein
MQVSKFGGEGGGNAIQVAFDGSLIEVIQDGSVRSGSSVDHGHVASELHKKVEDVLTFGNVEDEMFVSEVVVEAGDLVEGIEASGCEREAEEFFERVTLWGDEGGVDVGE